MCALVQFVLGAAGFLWPKFSQSSREVLVPYHMFLGRATFIAGLATMAVQVSPSAFIVRDAQGTCTSYATRCCRSVRGHLSQPLPFYTIILCHFGWHKVA